MTASPHARDILQLAAAAADSKGGIDLVALDVSGPLPLTDAFLLVSGSVERNVIAIASEVSPPKSLFVYVTKGDCLADGATLARRLPVTENGTFLVHLIAMPGDEFSVCAAAAPGADGTTRLYGKAATPVRVSAERDQSISDLKIDLRPSPPHRFPAR